MKRIVFIVLALVCRITLFAQQETADIGIFVGAGTPIVDYTKTYRMQSIDFNYGVFYRYNFNSRVAIRINFLNGNLRGAGDLNGVVAPSFRKNVTEVSSIFEINYLDFLLGSDDRRFSPVLFAGIGLAYYSGPLNVAVVTPSMPVGMGVKYALSKNWGVGAQWSMHKLFDDRLDNINDPYRNVGLVPVNSFWHNNDWISYGGISIWYKFYKGKRDCPAYDSLN